MTDEERPDYRLMPDLEDEPVMRTGDDVRKVLADVTFAASCVDMDWKWEVQQIWVNAKDGFRVLQDRDGEMRSVDAAGFLIRTTFKRPDRKTGVVGIGAGAWHHVPHKATESAVVKRAFVAAKAILEHELMESFKWKGARIFDPHNTVRELGYIQGKRYIDTIP